MRKLALIVLTMLMISTNPAFSQQETATADDCQAGLLSAVGFGFQGSAYKSLDIKLSNPSFSGIIEQIEEEETPDEAANASGTANASSTEAVVEFKKSELQMKYDQRLQRGNRAVPGGADQPPIRSASDADGRLMVNGVEFKLKFVFYQKDFSRLSADVFSAADFKSETGSRRTSRLPVPVGNLRLERASDFAESHAYIGDLSLNDEAAGVSGKFEVWLNDLNSK
ncbi:MAG: hypothetical protein A2W80_10755 [Candidatus Riflebacteria bacterium GWC2_50_8]|nr:MAG: hypothetical protein A2W80_10755 [Candidatus Riflebacteria bacterium GWC2_50_8]